MNPSIPQSHPPMASMGVSRWIGLSVAVLVLVLGPRWFPLSLPEGWDAEVDLWKLRCGLSIFVAIAVLWIMESLPLSLTALLVPVLAQLLGVMPLKESFAPFADPLIFLFLGGFGLATALSVHGVDRWCARRILSFAGNRFLASCYWMFGVTALLSMWISNTATTAVMLPLGLGLIASMSKQADGARNPAFLLLGLAYSASIGGLATIVGSPPNGIVARELGWNFGEWMKFGIAAVLVLLPTMVVVLRLVLRPRDLPCGEDGDGGRLVASSRPVLVIFLMTAALWALGGWLAPALGIASGYDTLVSLFALVVLIVSKRITWEQFEKGTPWAVLLLFGGGLALGEILKESSASMYLAQVIASYAEGLPLILVVGLVVMFTIFLTELASNTAVAALLVPVFASGAQGLGLAPEVLLMPLGLAASCAFMFPVATAPNALVHATGMVPQQQMVRAGFVLNLVCGAVLSFLAWLLLR